ncbi:MAG: hypothetical protein ABI396_16055, partial [Ktedonobacteraceae bacterium]
RLNTRRLTVMLLHFLWHYAFCLSNIFNHVACAENLTPYPRPETVPDPTWSRELCRTDFIKQREKAVLPSAA